MNKLNHIAIIMDGNGRWAQLKKKPRSFGHIKGARVAKKIITHAANKGLKHLTLYAFSTENWFRPEEEISLLMRILERYLCRETDNLVKQNIRFTTIGEISMLPASVQRQVERSVRNTAHCTGLQVTFAISYGSRQELLTTFKKLAQKIESGEIDADDIDETLIQQNLMTTNIPDPDLIIRTSGESRLSNFLLWQAAYSELYFTDILWPDFQQKDFDDACTNYSNRQRRFGKVDVNKNEELTF